MPPTEDSYQVVEEVTSLRDVTAGLKEKGTLLFLGTGGWHGSRRTLDECEAIIRGEDLTWLPNGAYVTVFLVNPEKVSIKWGEIHVKTLADVEYLRVNVEASLDSILQSQIDNTLRR